MMPRFGLFVVLVCFSIFLGQRSNGQDGKLKIIQIKPNRFVVGEIVEKDDNRLLVKDLKSGKTIKVMSDQIASVRDAQSEKYLVNYAGFEKYFAWLVRNHPQVKQLRSKVALVEEKVIYLDVGRKKGVQVGQEFEISRLGKPVKSPTSGKLLGRTKDHVSNIKAIRVDEELTKCELIGDAKSNPKVGDMVESYKKSIAVLPFSPLDESQSKQSTQLGNSILTSISESGEIKVIERLQIKKLIDEKKFEASALFDPAKAKKVGTLLNADFVVVGTINTSKSQKRNTLFVRLVETRSAKILLAKSRDVKKPFADDTTELPRFEVKGRWVLRYDKGGTVSNFEFKDGGVFTNSEKRGHFETGKWQIKDGKVYALILRGNLELTFLFVKNGKNLEVQHLARNVVTNKEVNRNSGTAFKQ